MAVGNVDKEQGEEVRDAPVNQSCGGSNPSKHLKGQL